MKADKVKKADKVNEMMEQGEQWADEQVRGLAKRNNTWAYVLGGLVASFMLGFLVGASML